MIKTTGVGEPSKSVRLQVAHFQVTNARDKRKTDEKRSHKPLPSTKPQM